MLTDAVQRWHNRRDFYHPAGEVICTREYEIVEIGSDQIVRDSISRHHYLKTIPLCRFRYGLYKGRELAGVAVFGYPTNDRTISSVFGFEPKVRSSRDWSCWMKSPQTVKAFLLRSVSGG